MQPADFRILVVDDEPLIARTLRQIFELAGFTTRSVTCPVTAAKMATEFAPHLLVSDVSMPLMSGIELAMIVKRALPACDILLITGGAMMDDRLRHARDLGFDFLLWHKPVPPEDLIAHARKAAESFSAMLAG